jgi:hypothetical protein
MATKPIIFRHQEPEVVRVPKFNRLGKTVMGIIDGTIPIEGGGGGGGTTLEIDGGEADNTGIPYIFVDGGEA